MTFKDYIDATKHKIQKKNSTEENSTNETKEIYKEEFIETNEDLSLVNNEATKQDNEVKLEDTYKTVLESGKITINPNEDI